jgi:hypothetical protein
MLRVNAGGFGGGGDGWELTVNSVFRVAPAGTGEVGGGEGGDEAVWRRREGVSGTAGLKDGVSGSRRLLGQAKAAGALLQHFAG